MVYQHFTLVPSMTAAENLVMARADVPRSSTGGPSARARRVHGEMPFQVPLDVPAGALAAGERQKTEILKQLYLDRRLMVLDEPTSTLTPQEAEEVLGLIRGLAQAGEITVVIITHKLKEVAAFADDVTVLRRGRFAGDGRRLGLTARRMTAMMIGEATRRRAASARQPPAEPRLVGRGLTRRRRPGPAGLAIDAPRGARRARSSASPASPATARASWSRCSPASAQLRRRHRGVRQALSTPAATGRRRAASGCLPRSRCATAACRGCRWPTI